MTSLGPCDANLDGELTPYSDRVCNSHLTLTGYAGMHFWLLLPQLTEGLPQRFSNYLNTEEYPLASLCCYPRQFKNWFLTINWLDVSFVLVYALLLPPGLWHSQLLHS